MAFFAGLPAGDVQCVLFGGREAIQVLHITLLGFVLVALQLATQLAEVAEEIAATRFTHDEEVLKVREQATVVRCNEQAAGPGQQ